MFKIENNELLGVEPDDIQNEILNIPEGVESLGSFFGRTITDSAIKIQLPESLKEIKTNAFDGLQVKDLRIPKEVEVIEKHAFSNMPLLRKVVNTCSVSSNGTWFLNCPNLSEVKEGLMIYRLISVNGELYYFSEMNKKSDRKEATLVNFSEDKQKKYICYNSNIYKIKDTPLAASRAFLREYNYSQYLEKYKALHMDDKFPLEDYMILSVQSTDKLKDKIKENNLNAKELTVRQLLNLDRDAKRVMEFGRFLIDIYKNRTTDWKENLSKLGGKKHE